MTLIQQVAATVIQSSVRRVGATKKCEERRAEQEALRKSQRRDAYIRDMVTSFLSKCETIPQERDEEEQNAVARIQTLSRSFLNEKNPSPLRMKEVVLEIQSTARTFLSKKEQQEAEALRSDAAVRIQTMGRSFAAKKQVAKMQDRRRRIREEKFNEEQRKKKQAAAARAPRSPPRPQRFPVPQSVPIMTRSRSNSPSSSSISGSDGNSCEPVMSYPQVLLPTKNTVQRQRRQMTLKSKAANQQEPVSIWRLIAGMCLAGLVFFYVNHPHVVEYHLGPLLDEVEPFLDGVIDGVEDGINGVIDCANGVIDGTKPLLEHLMPLEEEEEPFYYEEPQSYRQENRGGRMRPRRYGFDAHETSYW